MSDQLNQTVMENVINNVFNAGKYEQLKEYYHPDFIEHQFGLQPTIEGLKRDINFLRTAFPDFHLTIEDSAVDDDKVWVRMVARGTNLGGFMGPANGKSFEVSVFDVCKFRDGKIIEHWGCPDRFALLSQLGLLPKGEKQNA